MGQSKEDLERLIKACKEAWLAIDQGLMRRLIDSMDKAGGSKKSTWLADKVLTIIK